MSGLEYQQFYRRLPRQAALASDEALASIKAFGQKTDGARLFKAKRTGQAMSILLAGPRCDLLLIGERDPGEQHETGVGEVTDAHGALLTRALPRVSRVRKEKKPVWPRPRGPVLCWRRETRHSNLPFGCSIHSGHVKRDEHKAR